MEGMQNQGGQDPAGGYQPMDPGYNPQPKKKGFNWLACCGISCGVILIVGIIMTIAGVNFFNNFMGNAMVVAKELETTSAATIRAEAQSHSAEEVAANPGDFTDNWVALEGTVMAPDEYARKYFGGGDLSSNDMKNMSGQEGTIYFVDGGMMVVDISSSMNEAKPGDRITAYGKPFVMNFKAIPGVADQMPPELDNFNMFMAKEVDVTPAEIGYDEGTNPPDSDPGTDESAWTE